MPQFVIERDVPGAHTMTEAEVRALARRSVGVLSELGPQIQWIQSYVTENKVYCFYLAPDEATIRDTRTAWGSRPTAWPPCAA